MDGTDRGWLARLVASPRRRVLLAAVVVLLGVRAVLPFALRPILVARADEALVGHVELDDLDLSLLRGGITLHGLSVHTDERPAEAPALLVARRLWTQISWLALLTRTIEIEDFEVEGFVVHLERDASGLRLPRPIDAVEEPPEPEAEPARPWSFAADAVTLREGRIEFVDHTVSGEPERIALAIDDLSARELAVRSGAGEDEPGRLAIEAKLEQGVVSLSAWIQTDADGVDVRSTLVLDDIPIDEAHAYLSDFGWSEFSGTVDAQLEHHFQTGGAHTLKGRTALENLRIALPDREGPALAWRKLEVVLDGVDLVKRHAELASITSTGARVVVDPRAEQPLVLLAGRAKASEGAAAEVADTVDDSEAVEADDEAGSTATPDATSPAADAPAWSFRVGKLALDDATLDLRGAKEPLPLTITAQLAALSSEPGSRSPIVLTVANGEGQLRLAGELSPTPLAFDGRLTVESLALAPLLAQVEAPAVHWLTSGTLRANLVLRLARDLRASGSLGLAALDLEEARTAKRFGVEWKDLALGVQSFVFRDLMPTAETAPQRAVELALGRVALAEPRFILTRAEQGLVLPALLPGDAASEDEDSEPQAPAVAEPGNDPVPDADPEAQSPDDALQTDPAPPALPVQITVAEARVEGGRLELADRAIEPAYRGRIEALALHAKGVRWPTTEVEFLELSAEGLRGARLSLSGSVVPGKSKLKGKLVELPLAQFNPYLAASGYDLRGGDLSLVSRIRLAPEKVATRTRIVLAALDVGGSEGQSAFQESFGIPLDVALGLLEDLDGRIKLAVPVAGKPDKMKVGIGRLVGQALRKALVGALASPLKLLGAGSRDGKGSGLTPAPIAFRPGDRALAPDSAARVTEIADLLAGSPGIVLRLTGQTDGADGRIVVERALLEQLEASRGVRALASLGEISTRRAVREHLARKLAGKSPEPLAPADAEWLERHLAPATASTEVLETLAQDRAEALRTALVQAHGIDEGRLVIDPPRVSPPAPEPGVAIALGIVKSGRKTGAKAAAEVPEEAVTTE